MMKRATFALLFVSFVITHAKGQDTLPKFTVTNPGNNKIIIGWVNTMEDVRQISIQRSFDSLTGYKSILTVADPTSRQNGYVDTKAPGPNMFYRIYIMRDKGNYLFSAAQKPTTVIVKREKDTVTTITIKGKDTLVVKKAEPFSVRINGFSVGDSVKTPNPNGFNKPEPNTFAPSMLVYTNANGFVKVSLPEVLQKKYSIKFFDETDNFLFELKNIKEKSFKLDKTNFYHAGWFRFELYDDGKLLEKNKFYLEKDF